MNMSVPTSCFKRVSLPVCLDNINYIFAALIFTCRIIQSSGGILLSLETIIMCVKQVLFYLLFNNHAKTLFKSFLILLGNKINTAINLTANIFSIVKTF